MQQGSASLDDSEANSDYVEILAESDFDSDVSGVAKAEHDQLRDNGQQAPAWQPSERIHSNDVEHQQTSRDNSSLHHEQELALKLADPPAGLALQSARVLQSQELVSYCSDVYAGHECAPCQGLVGFGSQSLLTVSTPSIRQLCVA